MQSGPPPDDPRYTSEHTPLSPASPKPVHFPAPTNIPILENQMDIAFNQTELHMNDPAMHNTEVRPDAWKEGGEQQQSTLQDASKMPTVDAKVDTNAQNPEIAKTENTTFDGSSGPPGLPQPSFQSNEVSYEANATLTTDAASGEQDSIALQSTHDPVATSSMSQPEQADIPAPSTEVPQEQPQETPTASAPIDFQALLASLKTAPPNATPMSSTSEAPGMGTSNNGPAQLQASTANGTASSPTTASGLGAAAPGAGLPSRPPPQEQPLIHPNYVHSQHIRDYHPHAAHPAFQPQTRTNGAGNAADLSSRQFVPAVAAQGATPYSHANPSQASPISGTFKEHPPTHSRTSSGTPLESRREQNAQSGQPIREEDMKWTQETQRRYDEFIGEERAYVAEGRWEQFPPGSRLFVGNLSSERVTKRDIFHVFHHYGKLAQISIKQAYGFVQYLRKEDCQRALDIEQGRQIREKRIHLEISKPQKNRPNANANANSNANANANANGASRRSRSPDTGRRGPQDSFNRDRFGNNLLSRPPRDGHRGSYRSPSPPQRGYRDRYDDRYRSRSRSPRYSRYRSPSPRRGDSPGDSLPLPRRAARDVPDVQILVIEALSRDFISWVEEQFNSRGIRADSLVMSPRLDEAAVVRRQIMEGVQAVCKLDRRNQDTGRLDLRLFDRRGGAGNVQFEEYNAISPDICVELVKRAKSQAAAAAPSPQQYGQYAQYGLPPSAPPQQQYGYGQTPQQHAPPFGQPPPHQYQQGYPPSYQLQQGPPPAQAQSQNLQNVIGNLDPNNLQSLLAAMGQQQQPPPQQTPRQQSYGHYPPPQQQGQQDPLAALRANPALAGMLQQQQQQAPPAPQVQQQPSQQPSNGGGGQPQVNMAEILARLGSGR